MISSGMSIAIEVIFWLSHIESPWCKCIITFSFRRSSVSLNFYTPYSTIRRWRVCRLTISWLIGEGIWHRIRHSQTGNNTRQNQKIVKVTVNSLQLSLFPKNPLLLNRKVYSPEVNSLFSKISFHLVNLIKI